MDPPVLERGVLQVLTKDQLDRVQAAGLELLELLLREGSLSAKQRLVRIRSLYELHIDRGEFRQAT